MAPLCTSIDSHRARQASAGILAQTYFSVTLTPIAIYGHIEAYQLLDTLIVASFHCLSESEYMCE